MRYHVSLTRATLVALGLATLCSCAAYERAGQKQAAHWNKYQNPHGNQSPIASLPANPQTHVIPENATPSIETPVHSNAGLGKPAAGAEILATQRQNLATISTPKRVASQEVVERGVKELQTNRAQNAVQTFQDAISIDGTNGAAYFYLAKAHYQLGSYERALAMLDRASALLGDANEWMSKIDNLKATVERAMSSRTHT